MFSDLVLAFLIDISTQIIAIVGIAYIPLFVLIVFRGGRMRGLNPDNMSEKLWDLCFDTIREKIRDRVEELIQSANLNLPPRLTISDIAAHLHQDESIFYSGVMTRSMARSMPHPPVFTSLPSSSRARTPTL